MAIFKVTSRTWNREAAKRTVRYIAHRRDRDHKRLTRELFGKDGETLTKNQVYRLIDKANRKITFFRIALSPDRKTEDTKRDLDLRALSEITMMELQELFPDQDIFYVGAIHQDHTDNRHVHILALLQAKRIPKADLTHLIRTATREALQQRQLLDRNIARTPSQSPQPVVDGPQSSKPRRQAAQRKPVSSRKTGSMTFETVEMYADPKARTCPNCGPNHEMERHGRRYECPSCGLRLKNTGLGIEIIKRPGLELDLEGVGTT